MNDDFYTFGGGHFWEDLFFYQKWRIQRNYASKKCRLLDNWDIRRHEGTFEECRQAFVKYIDAYQIVRQKGHMIIMIHSLGQSKNVFKPLWRKAIKEGFLAAAVNYPSTQKSLAAHVKQFHFFLNHLEDVEKVSFVTLGAGNLILQALFNEQAEWQKKLQLGRVVEVSPCCFGSRLWGKLAKMKVLDFVIGPMGKDLAPHKVLKMKPVEGIECGTIISNKPLWEKALEKLLRLEPQKETIEGVKKCTNAKDVIRIEDHHFNIFNNAKVCRKIITFLQTGDFN